MSERLTDQIARRLESLDDAFHAKVDADVARRLAEGEQVDWSRFLPQPEDPLGYAWCEGEIRNKLEPDAENQILPHENEKTEIATTIVQVPPQTSHKSIAMVVIALAASIFGIVIGRMIWHQDANGKSREVLIAQAKAVDPAARGNNTVAVNVEINSPRRGFATVLELSKPLRAYPLGDQPPITVDADKNVRYGPIESTPGTLILSIVTETPARDLIRKIAGTLTLDETNPKAFREALFAELWNHGYRWLAWAETSVPQP